MTWVGSVSISLPFRNVIMKEKLQAPSTKLQRNPKSQTPRIAARAKGLEFGPWCFSGTWSLVLGGLIASYSLRRAETVSSIPLRMSQRQGQRIGRIRRGGF